MLTPPRNPCRSYRVVSPLTHIGGSGNAASTSFLDFFLSRSAGIRICGFGLESSLSGGGSLDWPRRWAMDDIR